jgi:hypothetical protein
MSAGKYDINIEQGTSYKLSLTYKDPDGNIIPLTGYCARLIWTTNSNESSTFLTTDIPNNNYKFYIDETSGLITLLLSASYTNNLSFTSAKYDLELKSSTDFYDGGGKYTIRLLYGTISVTKRFSKNNEVLDCSI